MGVAVLSQLVPNSDYSIAFKAIQAAIDDLRPIEFNEDGGMIVPWFWDISILEFLVGE